jgi:hypothetical protein
MGQVTSAMLRALPQVATPPGSASSAVGTAASAHPGPKQRPLSGCLEWGVQQHPSTR